MATKQLKSVDDQIDSLKALGHDALSTVGSGRPGMTTLSIAEITGVAHHNVLRKARKFLEDIGVAAGGLIKFDESCDATLNLTPSSMDAQEMTYLNAQGKAQPMIVLSRDVAQAFLGTYNAKLAFATTVHLNHLLDEVDPERINASVLETIAATVEAAGEIREREKDNRAAYFAQTKRRESRKLAGDEKEAERYQRQARYAKSKAITEGNWKFVADGG